MVRQFILKVLIFFTASFTCPIYAETIEVSEGYIEEDYIEDVWTVNVNVNESLPTGVIASVNGKINHGDRLRIRIPIDEAKYCDYGNSITTFYSIAKNHDPSKLEEKIIPAALNKININVEALYSFKFLSGYSIFINMGWNDLKSIKTFFQNKKEASLELKDSEDLKTQDHFDVTKNTFSLNGLNEALDRARGECLRIVNKKEMKLLNIKSL